MAKTYEIINAQTNQVAVDDEGAAYRSTSIWEMVEGEWVCRFDARSYLSQLIEGWIGHYYVREAQ